MKQDRFLLTIVCLIGLLVVAALALFFMKKSNQNYPTRRVSPGCGS